MEIVNQISEKLGRHLYDLKSISIRPNVTVEFAPMIFFQYLCSFTQSKLQERNTKNFFKIDFPRVPYPKKSENLYLVKPGFTTSAKSIY
jgi:hypothetical protein